MIAFAYADVGPSRPAYPFLLFILLLGDLLAVSVQYDLLQHDAVLEQSLRILNLHLFLHHLFHQDPGGFVDLFLRDVGGDDARSGGKIGVSFPRRRLDGMKERIGE